MGSVAFFVRPEIEHHGFVKAIQSSIAGLAGKSIPQIKWVVD